MVERRYDVVLYGASGFVGRQTVQYFARHGAGLRWAIAGRNRSKLESVRTSTGGAAEVDVLTAASGDPAALEAMVAQTRVLLSTAGPFALYSDGLVDACVRLGTHYVDITGETPWVKRLIDRHHAQAAARGIRIIPCCGFDSVPSDIGAYLVARYLQQELQTECRSVKAYFQLVGGLNGGTLASGFSLYDSGDAQRAQEPFLLDPPDSPARQNAERNRDPQVPEYDADIDAWVSPFVMGVANTRVVRRSSALFSQWNASYGPDFTYQEYLKYEGPLGWLPATAVTAGLGIFAGALREPALRQWLMPLLPAPDTGPSEQTMNEGSFRCELVGLGANGQRVDGLVSDQGDPGNRATVKFVCESALALALDADALPGGAERGGILTPATGLGDVLVERLRRAGMVLAVSQSARTTAVP